MRHELPRLYDRVREAMTDIENWRYFQFGYSCTTGIMARVVHPLDRPLDAFDDANGELLPAKRVHASSSGELSTPLSPCTVGHLTQHIAFYGSRPIRLLRRVHRFGINPR